jgi:2-dehydro-3-deoxygluconokinase
MGARVVTLGELMLRLTPPGHERILQSPHFEARFGGAECNVAVSLAGWGMDVAFVTALAANAIGDAAVAELRKFGVDTRFIRRAGDRVGIYFVEKGAAQRPSKVLYDRANSSIAVARPGDFDWNAIFDGAGWLHISGITPAISRDGADVALAAVKAARAGGVTISCDYNYRATCGGTAERRQT